jgi:hypothetical protein
MPQLLQIFQFGSIGWRHFGQRVTNGSALAQTGQNCASPGISSPHFAQAFL